MLPSREVTGQRPRWCRAACLAWVYDLTANSWEQLMTQQSGTVTSGRQWLAGLGVLYGILFGVAAIATNQGPGINASATSVAQYFNSHHANSDAGIFLVLASCVALAFFAGVLRSTVFPSLTKDRGLMSVSAVGTAVWISGMLLAAALQTTLLDA